MHTIHEIVSQVSLLLDNRVSLDEFGNWMLLCTADIMWKHEADVPTKELARAIQTHTTDFEIGQIDEKRLREEPAKAIQPFSSSTV